MAASCWWLTNAFAYVLAVSAARDGLELMAVMVITSVWATSAADTDGMLPSRWLTACCTGALVTSCRSVCTSVGVTAATAPPEAVLAPEGCTRSWAVAEY